MNVGPQHPATHGLLRLVVELEGERVSKITPDIGYLHRGTEKLAETKTYNQVIHYTDRLDYLSPLSNNLAYVLAVEKLFGIEPPPRAQHIRVLLAELTRISSHQLWFASQGHDLGAMTAFFYTFRERELISDIFEMISGARMTVSYLRIGGLMRPLPDGFEEKVESVLKKLPPMIDEYETLLTGNEIFKARTVGVGVISAEDAINLALSGPTLRGSGVSWDARKAEPYSGYDKFDFDVPVGKNGDVYDRYRCRVAEMRESVKIASQALNSLPDGPVMIDDPKVALPPKQDVKTHMESLIHHFMFVSEGIKPPPGEVYQTVEAPRGELGFYVISDGSGRPYRLRIRPPCFVNLQGLSAMAEGRLLADLVSILGSIDIVLGDVDR
jgi:NADH-quinone oxidoreductase subunit D